MAGSNNIPSAFRHVCLILAREPGHPAGDPNDGYDLMVPLTPDGRLDADLWRAHRDACRVRRFTPGREDRIGRLRRKPGGQWFVDYEKGERVDEAGFRLGEERFISGEYVSINRAGRMHTYQVTRVEKPT
ncbi:hypothetical protein [Rhizobium metallidurans]|uniref:Uncharacterized protein n=1 Tax=Rhizobium metallidurans TaxID=1265931 RepID=A0A7W6CRK3_9HYPH|nr:hypothetical protein [Rhizobium metallidurans]MBB3965878.1 hypothetical protein [Rhizobium metallidurans]